MEQGDGSIRRRKRRGSFPVETVLLTSILAVVVSLGVREPDTYRRAAFTARAQLGLRLGSALDAVGVTLPSEAPLAALLPTHVADPWTAETEARLAEVDDLAVASPEPELPEARPVADADDVADPHLVRGVAPDADWGSDPWRDGLVRDGAVVGGAEAPR